MWVKGTLRLITCVFNRRVKQQNRSYIFSEDQTFRRNYQFLEPSPLIYHNHSLGDLIMEMQKQSFRKLKIFFN